MNIDLKHIVLHQLRKDENDELQLHLRGDELESTPFTELLVSQIHTLTASKAKGFATFKEESIFKDHLIEYRSKQIPFDILSKHGAVILQSELVKYPFAEEGTIVFAEYSNLATEYLFIGMINTSESLKVTESLDLGSSAYLDVQKMDIAVILNLTTFETDKNSNRYLSYIQGRVGRKVSDFFMDFLGAESGLNTKQQNAVLIQAVNDFCNQNDMNAEETLSIKKQAFEHCNDLKKDAEEVSIASLSDEISNTVDTSFLNFVQNEGYELEKSFPVDGASIKTLTKYQGSGGGLSIAFDSVLLNERIFYNEETQTLKIIGIPPNLKHALEKAKK